MLPTEVTQIRAVPIPPLAESEAVSACLSSPEHRLMASYRHPRRRHEFVAGRLALKQALLETRGSAVRIGSAAPLAAPLLPAAQRMKVLPDDHGHPRLWVGDAALPTHVSIAHAAGWAAAACSHLPIGVDVVEIDAPVAIPRDDRWLAEVEVDWRVRLGALLWGLRECLLKTGQISAKTLWSLNDVEAVPTCPADEIIARWPQESSLAPLEIRVEDKLVAGAFVLLSQSIMLVMTLMPAPQR